MMLCLRVIKMKTISFVLVRKPTHSEVAFQLCNDAHRKKKKKRNTQFRGRFFSNFLARRLAYSLGKQLSARQDHSIDKHLAHIERIGKI